MVLLKYNEANMISSLVIIHHVIEIIKLHVTYNTWFLTRTVMMASRDNFMK